MKRDLDLVRKILLACEEEPGTWAPEEFKFDGYTKEQIGFHLHLMGQAGLLRTQDFANGGSLSAIPIAMTWEGYEFLEAARNEGNWQKVKAAAQTSGGFVLSAMKEVLLKLAAAALSEQLGLKA